MCPNCIKQSLQKKLNTLINPHTQPEAYLDFKHTAHIQTHFLVHTHRDTYTTHRQTHSWDYEWVTALPSRAWGAGDFHTLKKQVTSAQLPYKCMYTAAMYRYSCFVCCKTCKYRTARENLFFFSPTITCVREEEGGRHRKDGVKAIRGH